MTTGTVGARDARPKGHRHCAAAGSDDGAKPRHGAALSPGFGRDGQVTCSGKASRDEFIRGHDGFVANKAGIGSRACDGASR